MNGVRLVWSIEWGEVGSVLGGLFWPAGHRHQNRLLFLCCGFDTLFFLFNALNLAVTWPRMWQYESSFDAGVRGNMSEFALADNFFTEGDGGVSKVVLRQC